uniref:C-C motif chemokine ligand 21 n=1 Tax=Homo sapiens TaxID=9606 RepID=A0AAQ5BHN2_HUMAN
MAQSLALSLLILVLAFGIPRTQGSDGGAQDCCLKYSQRKIPAKVVRSYRKQEPSLGCSIPAILPHPQVLAPQALSGRAMCRPKGALGAAADAASGQDTIPTETSPGLQEGQGGLQDWQERKGLQRLQED